MSKIEQWNGRTSALVENQDDGSYVPIVKLLGSTPPATEATLEQIRDRLTLDPYSGLKYHADETVGSTTYLLKAAGARWLLSKIVANATGNAAAYATVTNNPTITTPTAAWTARTTLVYGELGGA
jgi:hypothetical protein